MESVQVCCISISRHHFVADLCDPRPSSSHASPRLVTLQPNGTQHTSTFSDTVPPSYVLPSSPTDLSLTPQIPSIGRQYPLIDHRCPSRSHRHRRCASGRIRRSRGRARGGTDVGIRARSGPDGLHDPVQVDIDGGRGCAFDPLLIVQTPTNAISLADGLRLFESLGARLYPRWDQHLQDLQTRTTAIPTRLSVRPPSPTSKPAY